MHTLRFRALLLMTVFVPLSQARPQGSSTALSYGLMGAINSSTFGGSDATGASQKIGFAIGGFVRKDINDTWAFQGELEYTMKGAKQTVGAGTFKAEIDYVEIPLLFRASASRGEMGRPFLEFGPALAFKAGCTLSAESGTVSVSAPCGSGSSIKSFDFGAMAGVGYEFSVGGSKLAIGARYNLGLLDMADNSNAKNRNLQGVVGFRF
jgi:hypothetical protein